MNNFYKKYKPTNLDEIFGHERIVKELKKRFKNRAFSNVTFISGKSGKGKTLLGDIIAKSLVCTNLDAEGNPCNQCANCEDVNKESFSKAVKRFDSSDLDIEATRKIKSDIMLVNRYSKNTVYILNEFQELAKSPAAMGNLLTLLEKDIGNVYFILIAMDENAIPAKLKAALKNRTTSYHLRDIDPKHLLVLLSAIYKEETGKAADENIQKLIASIVYYSNGSARTAIQYLERLIFSEIDTEDALMEELNIVSEDKLFFALTHLVKGNAKEFFACIPEMTDEVFFRIRSILIDLQQHKLGIPVNNRMLNNIKDIPVEVTPIIDMMFTGHFMTITEMKYTLLKILEIQKNKQSTNKRRRIVENV